MKRYFFTIILMIPALFMHAVNPFSVTMKGTQSDGKVISYLKVGNGHIGFYKTLDGFALLRNSKGDLCYLVMNADTLSTATIVAHELDERNVEEQTFVRTKALTSSETFNLLMNKSASSAKTTTRNSFSANDPTGIGIYGKSATGSVKSIGQMTIPVIMVQFADKKMQPYTKKENVSRLFNEVGYKDTLGSVGSVKDYYIAQSDSAFVPTFEVVGPVTVSKPYAYYGKNNGSTIDINCEELVKEALKIAVDSGLDLSKFANSARQIPLVSFYYAGMGEHFSTANDENLIWAHYSTLSNVIVRSKFVDYTINSYFVGDEIWPTPTGVAPSGAGVFIHEFGHALGLPDFYNTNNNNDVITMNLWSIMDSGNWYNNGYTPVGFNAYERSFLGWLNIETLGNEVKECTLSPLNEKTGVRAYRIQNSANSLEYYILENHQTSTWFPKSMTPGMLVTHVDYNANVWNGNNINNVVNHPRMTYIAADNSYKYTSQAELKGDLYPGYTDNKELSTSSTPSITNNKYYGGTINSIYNIAKVGNIIRFNYLSVPAGINETESSLNDIYNVYSLDGKFVKRMSKSSLNNSNLVPGNYIVVGKKNYKINIQ